LIPHVLMLRTITILTIALNSSVAKTQLDFLNGTWQGIMTTYNEPYQKGAACWYNFEIDKTDGTMKGEARIETPFTTYFAYKNIKGKASEAFVVEYDDVIIGLQENASGTFWCLNAGKLTYDPKTGYLSGEWRSPDCKNLIGKITMFRSKYTMSKSDTSTLYHSWFNNMAFELNKGWNAWYVRDAELGSFEMQPVFFDHDMDELKPEFESYLRDMVRVVESHSDLRIKVIGHTDSNGTDQYNIDLSSRRANKIKEFLIGCGLREDRVVIEFRGEIDPTFSNESSTGKQLNRRVDFEFI